MLIVEDDADTRRMLVTALTDAGFEAIPALDGKHALRTALATDPAAIVLDLMMPEMSGEDFVREYREFPGAKLPPIVVVSAKHGAAEIAAELGARSFVAKPLDLDELMSRLTASMVDSGQVSTP